VILAGGVSSRMKKQAAPPPGTDARLLREAREGSKSMIGVGEGGRPFMDYLLFNAREAGYRDVVIVIGEGDSAIRTHYGVRDRDNEFRGLRISYAIQPIPSGRTKPLGTADALLRALLFRPDWAGSRCTVCNSDNLYSREVLARLLACPSPGALMDYDRDALQFDQARIEQFAVLQKDERGYLTRIVEKPSPADFSRARDAHGRVGVSMNIFRFSYDLIIGPLHDVPLHPVRMEKELPSAVAILLERHPGSVLAIPVAEYVPDMTSPGDITQVQEYLASHFPHFMF
jgi:NDP-sugar pyrophosphorylase family protein